MSFNHVLAVATTEHETLGLCPTHRAQHLPSVSSHVRFNHRLFPLHHYEISAYKESQRDVIIHCELACHSVNYLVDQVIHLEMSVSMVLMLPDLDSPSAGSG